MHQRRKKSVLSPRGLSLVFRAFRLVADPIRLPPLTHAASWKQTLDVSSTISVAACIYFFKKGFFFFFSFVNESHGTLVPPVASSVARAQTFRMQRLSAGAGLPPVPWAQRTQWRAGSHGRWLSRSQVKVSWQSELSQPCAGAPPTGRLRLGVPATVAAPAAHILPTDYKFEGSRNQPPRFENLLKQLTKLSKALYHDHRFIIKDRT